MNDVDLFTTGSSDVFCNLLGAEGKVHMFSYVSRFLDLVITQTFFALQSQTTYLPTKDVLQSNLYKAVLR